jgi:Peptidase family C25/Propeptide_C25
MKRRFFAASLVVLLCLLPAMASAFVPGVPLPEAAPAQVQLVERTGDTLVVDVAIPELQWTQAVRDGATWQVVTVEGMGVTTEVGRPLVPVFTRLIAVDALEGVAAALTGAQVDTYLGVNLIPAQPRMDRNDTELPPFTIDDQAYATDAFFPAAQVTVGDPIIIHGRRFVPVHFSPLSYNPASGELRVMRTARIEITGGLKNATNPLRRALAPSAAFAPIFAELALTFDRKDAQENWHPTDGAIVVVVFDAFANAITPYVEWKEKKGLEVEVYLTSELPGAALNPQQLKTFFYERYNNAELPPLDYILLVGDNQHIKTLTGIGNSAADSMFVTLDGNDYFPDVIIARFPAGNLEQLNRSVAKSVGYEMDPQMATTDWYSKGTVMSGSDSVDDENASFVGDILLADGGFTSVDELFTSRRNFNPTNITGAVNQGRSWLAYFGHGSATTWSSPFPGFTNQNVAALQNNRMLPVITDIACDNAHFDAANECFAEVWIENNENTGAAAIFAASRNTPFYYTDKLGRGVATGHFQYGFRTFGAAAYFGKMYMYYFFPEPAGSTCEEVMQHYLIFGDPELNVWSAAPTELEVDLPATIEQGAKLDLTITVDLTGGPLAGSLVHIWRDGEFDAALRTDVDGVAVFELPASLSKGDLNVFITGQNGLPYEDVIEIVPAAPPADDDDDATPGDDDDDTVGDDDDSAPADDDDDSAPADDDDDDDDSGGCS